LPEPAARVNCRILLRTAADVGPAFGEDIFEMKIVESRVAIWWQARCIGHRAGQSPLFKACCPW